MGQVVFSHYHLVFFVQFMNLFISFDSLSIKLLFSRSYLLSPIYYLNPKRFITLLLKHMKPRSETSGIVLA